MPTTIVADRMLTRCKYVDTITLTGFTTPTETDSTLAFSYKDLVINAADPWARYGTITDDVAAGLEAWAQFYNYVAVTSCKVKVTPVSFIQLSQMEAVTSNPNLPYSVCLTPMPIYNSTAVSLLATYNSATVDFLEQPYRRFKYFEQTTPYQQLISQDSATVYYSAQSGNNVTSSVSNYMTAKKMMGFKNLYDSDQPGIWTLNDPTALGATSAWNYVLTVKSTVPYDGVILPAKFTLPDMVCRIEIVYGLAFKDRKPQFEEDS